MDEKQNTTLADFDKMLGEQSPGGLRGSTIALLTVAIAIVLGAALYGLNHAPVRTSIAQAQSK